MLSITQPTAIRAQRVRLGISQNKLSKLTDIAPSNISRLERGVWPDCSTMITIAAALSQVAIQKGLAPITIADLVAPLEVYVDAAR